MEVLIPWYYFYSIGVLILLLWYYSSNGVLIIFMKSDIHCNDDDERNMNGFDEVEQEVSHVTVIPFCI